MAFGKLAKLFLCDRHQIYFTHRKGTALKCVARIGTVYSGPLVQWPKWKLTLKPVFIYMLSLHGVDKLNTPMKLRKTLDRPSIGRIIITINLVKQIS